MKKGQIQTMETIAVLFIFFIIISFVFIFVSGQQKQKALELIEDKQYSIAKQIVQKVMNMPELQSTAQGTTKVNVLDVQSIRALQKLIEEDVILRAGVYRDRFSTSTITIREIYPGDTEYVVYSNPKEDYKGTYPFFIPVSLYNPLHIPTGKYAVGMIEVTYYS